ncbi:TauD/TfdA family dioxygenase [Sphingomonas sp.]|uniref:TauD/TfdA dioxygenase family protein n=1 Tax=Sphingomonas sp. TaxID=28214 RepID=UPI0025D77250|nr:TauD/TfdA family dioxygenase [Sphingomonas sp.]
MQKTKLDIRPLAGALGAEIRGADLRRLLDEDDRKAFRRALLDHLVIFFPDQGLSNEELLAFGKTWGALATYDFSPTLDADPEVVELAASSGKTADIWHTDLTHQPDPPLGSVLTMVRLPAVGGDTMWLNQYLSYERLSAPIRNLIDGLTAIHEYPDRLRKGIKNKDADPGNGTEHAVVQVHPETGRKCLYVNRMYTTRIPQLSPSESHALLQMLFAHSEDSRNVVRYRWSEGTTAVWDNRCTQHCVVNDFEGERVIRRVTIAADPLAKIESPWGNYVPGQSSTSTMMGVT